MNNFIASLTPSIARFVLVASASFAFNVASADELKDISKLADQGQTAVALDRINTFIAANPKNAQALFMKGVLLAEQGRRDEAIKSFTEVTERFPNLPEPYNNLAVLYADQGQFDKARKALETAIKTHPSYATAHENLGDIYARMASEAYDKALQLDTGNTRAQGKLSLIKDLFGTGNKTTIAAREPVKSAATANVAPTEVKKTPATATNNGTATNNADNITTAVNDWAQAWANKDLAKYFASYADDFKPAKGQNYKAWEKQRRDRISAPSNISVELNNFVVTANEGNTAKVQFKQIYRADKRSPIRTSKTLLMRKSGDSWLITEEIASN
ncbi:MAG: tetratricopeptide repeat protein [Methylotenera sp.]|jgi:tetratricopeptide (TPR) repeat protein|uniref:tetratricopeptide repeat protein n=1 Tax=Methylotenera sp. TaxID=2051956 RepID=UPI0027186EC8|nr:tetratricopeptide repeat protein [Methylotenera sp.]MDO9151443.1 tetratricopeptide repeat protein [Methylotenera sp.]